MPIKPENKARYPSNWKQIREHILQRAGFRCEHPGCSARHREIGYWREETFVPMPIALREAGYKAGDVVACSDGGKLKLIMIVLTIAHLDHMPEKCADDNLRAWCQKHHLRYDADHHAKNARETRRKKLNNLELALV